MCQSLGCISSLKEGLCFERMGLELGLENCIGEHFLFAETTRRASIKVEKFVRARIQILDGYGLGLNLAVEIRRKAG
jgi:hypothetical protein